MACSLHVLGAQQVGSLAGTQAGPALQTRQTSWLPGRRRVAVSGQNVALQRAHAEHVSVRRQRRHTNRTHRRATPQCSANGAPKDHPLHVVISGAPASGKGTQCEKIVEKYGLAHISAGDLLRAEVAAGSEYGKRVKSYMDSGNLVPDDVVITIVKERLAKDDAQKNGWLLDGYPRSASQAEALEKAGIRPDIFITLEVEDDSLVERVVGRRLDPETGRIYHLKFSPPENDAIASRLQQRSDDTEEKVKNRLKVYHSNLASVEDIYEPVLHKVDGNRSKDAVFSDIDRILSETLENFEGVSAKEEPQQTGEKGDGAINIPTQLNAIPHARSIREFFYREACRATSRAVQDGYKRLEVRLTIPELNPEMDVYRIGTLLELMRELAFTFSDDGKRVKVCVQGSMGEGIFSGMPLALAGTRRLMEKMDWGDEEEKQSFIRFGAVGGKFVDPEDDVIIIMAPQNAVGNNIIPDLESMVEAAGDRPLIIVNPRLTDIPSASGVMQVQGRADRLNFTASFFKCYHFRLLYKMGTNMYPIVGAFRYSYPGPYQIYKRVLTGDEEWEGESYQLVGSFDQEPERQEMADVLRYKKPKPVEPVGASGPFWKFW